MPSDSVGRVIGNTLLQIVLLPFNFIIWLVTSPELITLLCILSEILIELVVSAVMAGVSIIVSAVILMEDDPEPSLIMTPPSYPKKSFLHGGDSTCITYSEKEEKPKDVKKNGDQVETIEDEDRKSVDKTDQRTSLSSRSLLDRWLPKYGTPREDTRQTPVIEIPVPPVEGSEPESNVTEGSGETFRSTDEDTGTKSTEFDDLPQIITELVDAQLGGDGGSLKTDSERAGSLKTDNDRASSPKGSLKNDSDKVGSVKSDSERTGTGSMKTDSENASSANLKTDKDSAKIDSVTSGSEAGQYRSSVNSKK